LLQVSVGGNRKYFTDFVEMGNLLDSLQGILGIVKDYYSLDCASLDYGNRLGITKYII